MNLKESETYKNLQTALEKESLAYTQYTFFSDIAKKNGYGYIADVFKNTAHAEKEHGEQWFKFIKDGSEKSVYNNLALIVAKNLNLIPDIYELDKDYFNIAKQRITGNQK